jgi:chromosome segregation ATPase
MAISSIHFSAVKTASESHNYRKQELDYLIPKLKGNFENWSSSSIEDKAKEISKLCKQISGRKLQKNAEPIKEAVVNLNSNHTMHDLKHLGNILQEKFGMECFQIHIHRDEGHTDKNTGKIIINHHAHMLFDWQDKNKGTMLRLKNHDLSKIQTVVANALGMERGEMRVNSNRERLEAMEYKANKAEEYLNEVKQEAKQVLLDMVELNQDKYGLQQQLTELEQKKNRVRERIETIRKRREDGNREIDDQIRGKLRTEKNGVFEWSVEQEKIDQLTDQEFERAISLIRKDIGRAESEINRSTILPENER